MGHDFIWTLIRAAQGLDASPWPTAPCAASATQGSYAAPWAVLASWSDAGGSEATTAPSSRRSSTGSVREAREVRRVPCRAYDPIEKLLSMGVDKESQQNGWPRLSEENRAALSAVGGDVEKAMRLVLEDSKAHVSREACDWEFEGDKGWVPFDPESDGILQAAVDQGKEACELRFNRQRYLVDFTSLTQLNLTTQRSRRIRRRSGAASSSAPAPRAAAPAHERGPAPLPAPATEPPEPSEARSCTSAKEETLPSNSRMRWVALGILSLDICISYVPHGQVYVPGAFVTGPLVSVLGCRWTFVLATLLIALGCALRSASWTLGRDVFPTSRISPVDSHGSRRLLEMMPVPSWMGNSAFAYLLIGQGICALGQPLLVNCTSEMGADWFAPSDRPAAAMISNLMNFVGGSLSFVLPPLFVDDNPSNFVEMNAQISSLLNFQFHSAMVAFVLTLCLYRDTGPFAKTAEHRPPMNFAAEVKGIFRKADFWIINFQFMIYISIGHAFDAVEGSLLENYGSFTAWSTMVEARCITSAAYYQAALLISNAFMAISLLMGYMCLHYGWSPGMFITAVGIMGLSTPGDKGEAPKPAPGWGCSAELGSEVCFPAREATVNSLLEAFSNMAGVASIVWAQDGIDAHLGAAVLAVMAGSAVLGMAVLGCLSGFPAVGLSRCPRAEEGLEEGYESSQELTAVRPSPPAFRYRTKMAFLLWAILLNFVSVLMTATTAQFLMPQILSEPPHLIPKKHKKKAVRLKNGLKEPRTWLLDCTEKHQGSHREKIMSVLTNSSVAFFPCLKGRSSLAAQRGGSLRRGRQLPGCEEGENHASSQSDASRCIYIVVSYD
eukprot:g23567.t1